MDVLVVLGTGAAYLYSMINIIVALGSESHSKGTHSGFCSK